MIHHVPHSTSFSNLDYRLHKNHIAVVFARLHIASRIIFISNLNKHPRTKNSIFRFSDSSQKSNLSFRSFGETHLHPFVTLHRRYAKRDFIYEISSALHNMSRSSQFFSARHDTLQINQQNIQTQAQLKLIHIAETIEWKPARCAATIFTN